MRQILKHSQDPDLTSLLEKILQLRERQRILIAWLGPEARDAFHVLGWERATLHLGASSGAWKQWLRLQEGNLINRWNRRFPSEQVKSIHCRVQPTLAEGRRKSATSGPSAAREQTQAGLIFREVAKSVPDQALAAAMRRLARTLERP